MKILAIDTSTKFLCLGVYDGEKFYEYNLKTERALSELLVPTIERVLEALDLKVADIDYFACGLGPGSFTGIRIGMAVIKGLSIAANKPVAGVSSLDILAKNAELDGKRLIVPALDARRDLIYCCAYKNENGILKRKSEYLLLTTDQFLKKFKNEKPLILGDALSAHSKIIASLKGAINLDKDYWNLNAHNLMSLAMLKIKARQLNSAVSIKPIYLYPKECQIKTK